jgi:hypothetical protein
MCSATPAVSSEGLMTMVQPAASAPLILREGVIAGAFQPANPATTPMGSSATVCVMPPARAGIVRP